MEILEILEILKIQRLGLQFLKAIEILEGLNFVKSVDPSRDPIYFGAHKLLKTPDILEIRETIEI